MTCRRFRSFRTALRRVADATLVAAALVWSGSALAQTDNLPAGRASASLAEAEQRVFYAALQSIAPSMVRIDTIGGAQPTAGDGSAGFRQADGPTTGVIWHADGWILTSSVNFVRDPVIITVTLSDGRRFVARLVSRDRPARLALLKIDAADLPAARPIAQGDLRPGQWLMTAGFGFGGSSPVLSVGVLSAIRRAADMALQTDAKTSPANYGGPLFDVEGRVAGICIPLAPGEESDLAGVEWYDSGIGFAIHADFIAERFPRMQQGQSLERGRLGVVLEEGSSLIVPTTVPAGSAPAAIGPRVAAPPQGPAAAAGWVEGDVLVRVGDQPIATLLDLRRRLARHAAGDRLDVQVSRGGRLIDFSVRLFSESDFDAPEPASAAGSAPSSAPQSPTPAEDPATRPVEADRVP